MENLVTDHNLNFISIQMCHCLEHTKEKRVNPTAIFFFRDSNQSEGSTSNSYTLSKYLAVICIAKEKLYMNPNNKIGTTMKLEK